MDVEIAPEVRLYREVDAEGNLLRFIIRAWYWYPPGSDVPEHAEIKLSASEESEAWDLFGAIAAGEGVTDAFQRVGAGSRSYHGSDPPPLPGGAQLEESRPIRGQ